MELEPVKYIVGVEDQYLSQVMFYWLEHDKPCPMNVLKAKIEGLTAIKVTISTHEQSLFLLDLRDKLRCKLVSDEK